MIFFPAFLGISKARSKRIAAPLFLTKEYIQSSLDVFPVEFLDMKENHVVVFGEDTLGSLTIEGRHLRLFLEEQLKGKLIRVRQGFLENGLDLKAVRSLLKQSLNSLLPIFRNLLRLKNITPPIDKFEIITQCCHAFGLSASVFEQIYDEVTGKKKIIPAHLAVIFEQYLCLWETLIERVDASRAP